MGTEGRLLLFAVMYLNEQAANANDDQAELKELGVCHHLGKPPFPKIRGQEAALCQEGQPPTVTGSAER